MVNGAQAQLRAEQRDRALTEDVAHADACDASLLANDGAVELNERDMGAAYHALHTVRKYRIDAVRARVRRLDAKTAPTEARLASLRPVRSVAAIAARERRAAKHALVAALSV